MKIYTVELRSTAGVFGLRSVMPWLQDWAEVLKPRLVLGEFIRIDATQGQLDRLRNYLKRRGESAVSVMVVAQWEDDWP